MVARRHGPLSRCFSVAFFVSSVYRGPGFATWTGRHPAGMVAHTQPPNVQSRGQMDFASLSGERAGRSVAAHKPSGAHDRHARRARRSVVRSEPITGSQKKPISAPGKDRSGGDADFSVAASETADQRQAEYFLRLLAQSRQLSEHRIDQYHKAIATSESSGDVEGAATFRRMARLEEQDRQTLDGLIENLRRRFVSCAPSEISSIPEQARVAAR
jgi:hypothetical protein